MRSSTLAPFFKLLQTPAGPDVFNPWTDVDAGTDAAGNGPRQRQERLRAHLQTRPRYILLGEAAGYQGCHVSGIAFTSERLLLAGGIPRITAPTQRLSTRALPWSEPSATTVWGTLHALDIAATTILWNAYPWHPHRVGDPQSNRTPTRSERVAGLPVLEALLRAFPDAAVFAVGRNAEASLQDVAVRATPLRHPSMGGATAFRAQLRAGVAAAG